LFAALRRQISKGYHARKVRQGACHDQALIAFACRSSETLFATLREGTFSRPNPPVLPEWSHMDPQNDSIGVDNIAIRMAVC
jgi:hypothetical protein